MPLYHVIRNQFLNNRIMVNIRSFGLYCLIGLLMAGQAAFSQTKRITGTVRDDAGAFVPGSTIMVKNSPGQGAVSGPDGRFGLAVAPGAVLVVSAIGFEKKEITVGDQASLDIRLGQQNSALGEIVVTALGIRREKRQLTYSTQEIKGEVLTTTKEPGLLNAMTGRVSGVQITSSTGQPGSSSRIVIRGSSSLLGDNQALIVLDGVPINNDETGNAGAGAGISRLSDIDPAIIESINVLKGSAASALYGSRAARGVVMITTKNGGVNKQPTVTFNSQYSLEKAIYPEIQEKYALGENGVFFNGEDKKTSLAWGPLIDTLKVNGAPVYRRNPMKDFFRTGQTFTNSISVDGGSAKSSYFVSYSYLNQQGIVPTTNNKRHSLFAKYGTQVTDKINVNFQLNYTSGTNQRMPEGYDLVSPLWTLYTAPLTWNPLPYLDQNDNQRVFRYSRNNPYWALYNIRNNSRINRFIPLVTLSYNPLKWLSITERLGADIYAEQVKYYEAPSSALITTGAITDRNNTFRQFNHDLIIEARKDFGTDWNASLLLGNNVLSTYTQTMEIQGTGIAINNFDNVSNAERQVSTEEHFLTRKVGFYAQANMEYRKMLNLSLTGRYDGSSVLAHDRNFYPYGSASLGFVFSELMQSSFLPFGKLRVSYSSVGNDNIGPYSLHTPFTVATNFPFDNRQGFLISNTLGNPNLVNEKTNEFEIGLETRMLDDRLGLEVSYFNRQHKDLLTANIPISNATGFTSTTLNAGDMTNKGIEALLNATPVKTGKFRWDVTLNFSRIRNKVTAIYGSQDRLEIGQTWAFTGDPYGTFYNYGYARNAEGQVLIDESGLPVVSDSLIKIGNLQPDWLGGISNTLRYGNFSFSFFFDIRKGGDLLNSDDRYGYFYGTPKVTENREPRVVAGVNITDGKENTKPVNAVDYYQRLNLIYESVIQDGTYVKLRNASVSYQLPEKLLGRTPFRTASVSLTGRNLWIYSPHFTGPDPEVSSYGAANGSQGVYANAVPPSRSFNFSLNITFR